MKSKSHFGTLKEEKLKVKIKYTIQSLTVKKDLFDVIERVALRSCPAGRQGSKYTFFVFKGFIFPLTKNGGYFTNEAFN